MDSQFLFIVRIWLVDDQTSRQWRGSVEYIPAGQKLYFTSLRDLNDFISLQIACNAPMQPNDSRQMETNPK